MTDKGAQRGGRPPLLVRTAWAAEFVTVMAFTYARVLFDCALPRRLHRRRTHSVAELLDLPEAHGVPFAPGERAETVDVARRLEP